MTWSELVTAVSALMPIEAARRNVGTGTTTLIERFMVQCAIDLQSHIPALRIGNETTYRASDVVLEGGACSGVMPGGCRPLSAWVRDASTSICASYPVVLYPWAHKSDLTCGDRVSLYRYQFKLTISPDTQRFILFPAITDEWEFHIEWEGLKTSYAATDTVRFTQEHVSAFKEYVQWMTERDINRDLKMAGAHQTEYFNERQRIYVDIGEQKNVRLNYSNSPQAKRCLSCCVAATEPEESDILFVADFGNGSDDAEEVADTLQSIGAEALFMVGDCIYPNGGYDDRDAALAPYSSLIKAGEVYPVWGNHDLGDDSLVGLSYGVPLYQAFPDAAGFNDGKYYYVIEHSDRVHFFVLNSGYTDVDQREPDGILQTETQALWLEAALAASDADWKVVVFHRPPYTSDTTHTPGSTAMRWPFESWGADMLICGHGHNMERIMVGNIPLLINGAGGATLRDLVSPPVDGHRWGNDADFGFLRVIFAETYAQALFYDSEGNVLDNTTFTK